MSVLIPYIFNSFLTLPFKIFSLSSLQKGIVSIQFIPEWFSTKGQSTEKIIRSTPISMTEHKSAEVEKFPLVVI